MCVSSVFKLLCIYLFLEPPACQTPVDLAFIVDSSGSIGSKNYLKEKHFVKQLARGFGVAPGQSRAALVLYSNSASVKAGFDQYPTLEQFHKSVDDLPYEKGFTRIDLALEKANQEVFPQARKGVPKIAILITDGKQTKTADSKGLREASEPLRREGVRVLAVGVGSGVDSDELRLVTESDDDVVVAQSFPDLLVQIGNLTSRACELAGECKSAHLGARASRVALCSFRSSSNASCEEQITLIHNILFYSRLYNKEGLEAKFFIVCIFFCVGESCWRIVWLGW